MPTLSSRTVARLYRLLVERPGTYQAATLQGELNVSRTRLRATLRELEELNLVHLEVTEWGRPLRKVGMGEEPSHKAI